MIYAGIDEAGYGPLLGPLVISRTIFEVGGDDASALHWTDDDQPDPPDLWRLLGRVVCRTLAEHRKSRRLAVNDSKALKNKTVGIRHLEAACLAFTAANRLDEHMPEDGPPWPGHVGDWLNCLGSERTESQLGETLPWYAPSQALPWDVLPVTMTAQELQIACSMLHRDCEKAAVAMPEPPAAAVVFEDQFNRMYSTTRSKASVSFTFVARHIRHVIDRYGPQHPLIVVDRQGGRTRYRELLADICPGWSLAILRETPGMAIYRLEHPQGCEAGTATVLFTVDAEQKHLPVALASMTAKYTRELCMARFNAFFRQHVPDLKPTAGYTADGRRFIRDLSPHCASIGVNPAWLQRLA